MERRHLPSSLRRAAPVPGLGKEPARGGDPAVEGGRRGCRSAAMVDQGAAHPAPSGRPRTRAPPGSAGGTERAAAGRGATAPPEGCPGLRRIPGRPGQRAGRGQMAPGPDLPTPAQRGRPVAVRGSARVPTAPTVGLWGGPIAEACGSTGRLPVDGAPSLPSRPETHFRPPLARGGDGPSPTEEPLRAHVARPDRSLYRPRSARDASRAGPARSASPPTAGQEGRDREECATPWLGPKFVFRPRRQAATRSRR